VVNLKSLFARRLLRHPVTLPAAATLAIAGAIALWIVMLGPAPLGEGLDFSTTAVDRDGRGG
jgi:hypothetical protein